ncbi:Hypothetical predicted protein [Mytilus galloprovincialis]|uniref:DDE Tnp4 domain-containing protein n=1 Tax=Mytilus galloprovincialis TaxID=29158 RepID=A0A8B6HPR9_MYTGA|nr:Hypothetical predicted protein [Mytilus galloprovincialis]
MELNFDETGLSQIVEPKFGQMDLMNEPIFHVIPQYVLDRLEEEGTVSSDDIATKGTEDHIGFKKTDTIKISCVYLHGTEWWMGKWCTAGDSGYPCRPFLMTPYQNPVLDHQKKYNRCHCSTRSVIERTFGRLKRRFHILHSEIRMIPSKACKIIMACAILHNICILLNEPDIEDDGLVIDNDGDLGDRFFGNQDGRGVRDHISSTFFNR